MTYEHIKTGIFKGILFVGALAIFFCAGCAASSGQIQQGPLSAGDSAEKKLEKHLNETEMDLHKTSPPEEHQGLPETDGISGVSVGSDKAALPVSAKTEDMSPVREDVAAVSPAPDKKLEGTDQIEALPESLESPDDAESVVFNFDDAGLREVIRTIAGHLNINYMFDVAVDGKITVYTAGELKKKDIWPVFYQILEARGLTAVRKDQIYHIVNLKDAPRMPITSYTGSAIDRVPPEENIIIQIIPLQNINAQEMVKLLTPFISESGQIISHEQSNTLVVVENKDNIRKIVKLANAFDADIFEKTGYRFFPLHYGDADSIALILNKVFAAFGPAIQTDVVFVPITRLNTLLAVSGNPKILDEVERLIQQYDIPSQSTEPGIYVYSLKNGRAADIAEILNSVFAGKQETIEEKDQSGESESIYRNPLAREAKSEKAKSEEKDIDERTAQSKGAQSSASLTGNDIAPGSGTLKGDINITADESRNALILEATPADYLIIKNLLTKLDIMPRQVLIEVTLAEVSLDESTSMGVEWTYVKGDANLSTNLLDAKLGDSGLRVNVGNPDRWTAVLSALATENKVNILSRPSILASNSMPAKIDVSQEIPVASSQYEYTSGDNPMVSTDIEYRDTGIMLSVTPNINEQGLVTMDISQEISEQASNVSVGGKDYPSFFKRNTETNLTVQSGQTIVIGGLIRETQTDGASGMPWFSKLPVLGFLFGKTSDSVNKTELIILISPYVIDSPDDVDAITREFSRKIGALVVDAE